MKVFIARDGEEGFYDLQKYFSLLDIESEIFYSEPGLSKKEIANQIFSKTKCNKILILRENEIISSYQLNNILLSNTDDIYSIFFPKIRYEYKVQNDKKIFISKFPDFTETHASNLWSLEYLQKSFNIVYEESFYNISNSMEKSVYFTGAQALIFQFNKLII